MRRFKQALSQAENITILKQKTHGILALCDEKSFPYTVPLNYVYLNDKIYFHCATVGRKLDIIHQNNKASFCVIDQDAVIPEKFTTAYSSVIASGTIKAITDEKDKQIILEEFIRKFSADYFTEGLEEIKIYMNRTCILELTIEELTGKEGLELQKLKTK
ncbi:pyridoxamine 5'-phosphate oxidase family protein [uncultured Megamonas sp.]|uniref:pyridoxamine 5'-phosphate oxidase family protein n=1 Tax=uncultured Megamonas sp. TaxID=286140 RepID=UPI0025E639AE|nr:pyridoxamine 5'-phosphate oxidase family protein [uncultured Megamonas sp.]